MAEAGSNPKKRGKPNVRITRTADACRRLIEHLVDGQWAAGGRIPSERELCLQLSVGRASLREALKALEAMGMIDSRVGEGTFVCDRSEFLSRPLLWAITGSSYADVHEIVEARVIMEVELAGFAAERATVEDVKAIAACLDEMRGAGSLDYFLDADLDFHMCCARAGHNQILLNAVEMIRDVMRKWIAEVLRTEGSREHALAHHESIFLAITKQDPEAARAAMREHLEITGELLMKVKSQKENGLRPDLEFSRWAAL
jgi:GntR family transcriptional regulator, transcriptional repressor for pyruvate dehydrogenase complex